MAYCTTDWYVSNRLGVATDTPCTDLHVAGANAILRVGPYYNDGDRDYFEIRPRGLDTLLVTSNESMTIQNCGGTISLMPASSNNVGINTTSPTLGKLQVNAGGNEVVGFFGSSGMTANQSNYLQIGKNQAAGNNAGEISFKYVGDNNASNMVSLGFYGNGQLLNILPNGNTGIGTTSPQSALHVTNTVAVSPSAPGFHAGIDSNGYASIQLTGCASLGSYIDFSCASTDFLGRILYDTTNNYMSFGVCQSERMRITNSGNVGIGTPSPSYRLHVCRTGNSDWLASFENTDGTESISTYISHGGGYGMAIDSTENNTNYIFKAMAGTGNGGGKGSVPVIFAQHNGFVGIGTASPQSALHVSGALAVCPSGTGIHMGIDSGGYAGIQLTGGTSQGAYIDFSCANADAPGRIIYYNSSNSMEFTICAAARMTILCNGNIGVATAAPSYKLHVNGTFYAAGSSIKYKEGICNYNTDSCLFMCLKPVTYQYKDEFKHLGKELKSESQIGLIAEDVAEVMPELAVLVNEEDEKVVRNVDYEKLSIVLLSELQKLRKEVDELKNNK